MNSSTKAALPAPELALQATPAAAGGTRAGSVAMAEQGAAGMGIFE